MSSLEINFDELLARIRYGRDLSPASFEPIYYLIFPPSQILEVKRQLPAWLARLRIENWDVTCFSMAEEIAAIVEQAPLRKIWLDADRKAPLVWKKANDAVANLLTKGALQRRLEAVLETAQSKPNGLVLVTDLEALHPYLRIGAIEAQLYGKFSVPTVFLYPGKRAGKTGLSFLGFYPEDGNYRSNHVGD